MSLEALSRILWCRWKKNAVLLGCLLGHQHSFPSHQQQVQALCFVMTMIVQYLALFLGVLGALLASQLPGYTLQYMHNLNGRLDELEPIVEEFRRDVAVYNYTLESALLECETADGLLDALCDTFEDILLRYEELLAHYTDLDSTSPYVRPFRLMSTVHSDIAESVWEELEPAVPTSSHGLAYALLGFLTFWVPIQLLYWCCSCHRMMRRRRKGGDEPDVLPRHNRDSASTATEHTTIY